ncbi:MAG: CDP-glycerol glycerophosphotransferase family protein [Eubacteriales bacterium]|nr:CDP-glycerol glycerophosphotransferase family protein [Eubacteriales bacterium]
MVKQIIKGIVFKICYPFCYWIAARKSVRDDKVIFVENHQETLSDNFRLLYDELQKRQYQIKVHYLKVADSNWKDIIIRTVRLLWDMADAKCIFLNESNSAFGVIPLRKETKLVQLWHACGAFKKWGFSVAQQQFGEDQKTLEKYSGHRNYWLVPVSGQAVCWAYAEAFGLKDDGKVIRPLGVSRTDVFFDAQKKVEARNHLYEINKKCCERKIVLYAPTFRGDIKQAKSPDVLDIEKFTKTFGTEYMLVIKQHPFVKQRINIPGDSADSCMEITNEMTIEELLMVADVCITDYSSVVFEYSLMHKPMIFLAPDLDQYYDERGFYYAYREFVPGPIVTDMSELMEQMQSLKHFDYQKLETFRSAYMSGCDGNSTKRILETIYGKNFI